MSVIMLQEDPNKATAGPTCYIWPSSRIRVAQRYWLSSSEAAAAAAAAAVAVAVVVATAAVSSSTVVEARPLVDGFRQPVKRSTHTRTYVQGRAVRLCCSACVRTCTVTCVRTRALAPCRVEFSRVPTSQVRLVGWQAFLHSFT